jgi:hypothetical protein
MAGKTPWGSECVVGLEGLEPSTKPLWDALSTQRRAYKARRTSAC